MAEYLSRHTGCSWCGEPIINERKGVTVYEKGTDRVVAVLHEGECLKKWQEQNEEGE